MSLPVVPPRQQNEREKDDEIDNTVGVQAQPERGDRMRRQKVNTLIESKIRSLKTGVQAQPGKRKQGKKETGHGVQAQPDNKSKED